MGDQGKRGERMIPSREWITERLADYKACRSHREIAAIEGMFLQWRVTPDDPAIVERVAQHMRDAAFNWPLPSAYQWLRLQDYRDMARAALAALGGGT
jgi:hypothetical protein